MKWFGIILGILIVFILILIFTKLTVKLNYKRANNNDALSATFLIWKGLISYTLDIPLMSWNNEEDAFVVKEEQKSGKKNEKPSKEKEVKFSWQTIKNQIDKAQDFIQHVSHFKNITRHFLSKISVTRLEWHSRIGTGDAAQTAVLYGAAWTLKGNTVGLVSNFMNLKAEPQMQVTPLFNERVLDTSFECMFSFRIGNAIGAALKVLKYWKGRRQPWQNIQSRA
ncbi:DUF2953 domain-containing protein [Bacillus marinisedimentorum]|uniref:DUF2953 domain-containing protein n=1 Tax=Bacillus marinisedimentorum TaxID=1821260 RepID=UPI000A813467|nr:DUF2953 domain-containing protein [Bacillus marinisedimentorum]